MGSQYDSETFAAMGRKKEEKPKKILEPPEEILRYKI